MKLCVLLFLIFTGGCTLSPMKCTPWIPVVGWEGIMNKDIDKAIRESSAGAKCETSFY